MSHSTCSPTTETPPATSATAPAGSARPPGVGSAVDLRAAGAVAVAALLFASAALLYVVGRPLGTDDLWWHLKLGELYAAHGPWLAEEPLLHTASGPTIPHEWLFQVALHGLERAVGLQGLRGVHVLAVVLILAGVLQLCRRAGGALAPAALATLIFLALSWYRLIQLRPELATVGALLGLYALLLEGERPASRCRLVAALGLLLVWANLHSMVAIGLALLLAALLGLGLRAAARRALLPAAERGRDARAGRTRPLALALGLGLLVTLANPRGFAQLTTFFVESGSGDIWRIRDEFQHWNPFAPPLGSPGLSLLSFWVADALLLAFAAAALAAALRALRRRSAEAIDDVDAVHLGLGAAGLVAMAVAVRFTWMGLFPLLYVLRALRRHASAPPGRARALAVASAGASVALAALVPAGIHLDAFARETSYEPAGYWASPYLTQRYGASAMQFLRDAHLHGRMFHPFHLGGYLGYWLTPDLRTFIDGRLDHVPSAVLADYLRIQRAQREGKTRRLRELLDAWSIDVVVAPSFPGSRYPDQEWTAPMRRVRGWVPVFSTLDHTVFLRHEHRNQENFERVARYYRQRQLPFAFETGEDVDAAIRLRPNWSHRQGLLPPDYAALLEASAGSDPVQRRLARERLGEVYWRIGAFETEIPVEREILAEDPKARAPRRRLADALLLSGHPSEALEIAEALQREAPDYEDIAAIARLAAARAEKQRRGGRRARPPAPERSHRRATLPPGHPGSTIADAGLNFRVRDGNGCGPCSMDGGKRTGSLARPCQPNGVLSPRPSVLRCESRSPAPAAREWSSLTGD